jgi:hypothetical protein
MTSSPAGGAQVHVTVSCGWCTLRAPTLALQGSGFNITANFLEASCAAVCPDVSLPVATMHEHLLLPAACRECVVAKGWEAIREGRQQLRFFATSAQVRLVLWHCLCYFLSWLHCLVFCSFKCACRTLRCILDRMDRKET